MCTALSHAEALRKKRSTKYEPEFENVCNLLSNLCVKKKKCTSFCAVSTTVNNRYNKLIRHSEENAMSYGYGTTVGYGLIINVYDCINN